MRVKWKGAIFECAPADRQPRGHKQDHKWVTCGQCHFGLVHPERRTICKRCGARVVKR